MTTQTRTEQPVKVTLPQLTASAHVELLKEIEDMKWDDTWVYNHVGVFVEPNEYGWTVVTFTAGNFKVELTLIQSRAIALAAALLQSVTKAAP